MARHHFVPLFLLRRWAVNGISFEPSVGRVIENARAIVASACQIKNLNTFFAVPAAQRDFPETQFFTPCVDTPAATALDVMLAKGVSALTEAGLDPPACVFWREMDPKEVAKAFDIIEAAAPSSSERSSTGRASGSQSAGACGC